MRNGNEVVITFDSSLEGLDDTYDGFPLAIDAQTLEGRFAQRASVSRLRRCNLCGWTNPWRVFDAQVGHYIGWSESLATCTEKSGKRHFSTKVNSNNRSVSLRTNWTWLLSRPGGAGRVHSRRITGSPGPKRAATCQPLAGSSTVATFSSIHQNRLFFPMTLPFLD